MPKQNPKSSQPGWVTIRAAAELLGKTPSGVRRSFVPLLPPEAIVAEPTPCHLHAPTLIDALIARAKASILTSDPMAAEADSPALERWRAAKAELAEYELAEKRETVVPIEAVKDEMTAFSDSLRRFGERLMRRYGPDASRDMNKALDQAMAATRKYFHSHIKDKLYEI